MGAAIRPRLHRQPVTPRARFGDLLEAPCIASSPSRDLPLRGSLLPAIRCAATSRRLILRPRSVAAPLPAILSLPPVASRGTSRARLSFRPAAAESLRAPGHTPNRRRALRASPPRASVPLQPGAGICGLTAGHDCGGLAAGVGPGRAAPLPPPPTGLGRPGRKLPGSRRCAPRPMPRPPGNFAVRASRPSWRQGNRPRPPHHLRPRLGLRFALPWCGLRSCSATSNEGNAGPRSRPPPRPAPPLVPCQAQSRRPPAELRPKTGGGVGGASSGG